MSPNIGFVVMAHHYPSQLLRLTLRLIALYDNPPIVCHFDFGQSSLEGLEFPKQVQFVQPHLNTRWGHITYWLAFKTALGKLYETSEQWDWFVLLSASDYPTQPPSAVKHQLASGGFDAYLDHRRIVYPSVPDPSMNVERHGFGRADWIPLAYDRYVAVQAWVPSYSLSAGKAVRLPLGLMRSKFLVRPFNPFSEALQCFGGDAWITANRKTAERILTQTEPNRTLLAHYSTKTVPEESLTHTIVCNQPDLKVSPENFRYADWTLDGPHPKVLGMEDIEGILASRAHFARKFDLRNNGEVLDALDRAVDER